MPRPHPAAAPEKDNEDALSPKALLELSTGHLSHATFVWLENRAGAASESPAVVSTRHGWFVSTPCLDPDWGTDAFLPPDLRLCLRVARGRGAGWILFDQDAEEAPGLPLYQGNEIVDGTSDDPLAQATREAWLPGVPRDGVVRQRHDPRTGWPAPGIEVETIDPRRVKAKGLRAQKR